MDAESRRDREALEDRWSLEGARDPRERKRGESARCPSTGNREPPRLSGRRVRSGEGPRDRVRLEAAVCGEGDQAGAHGGRREALPQPLPPGVATRDPAPLDGRAQSRDGTAPRETRVSWQRRPRLSRAAGSSLSAPSASARCRRPQRWRQTIRFSGEPLSKSYGVPPRSQKRVRTGRTRSQIGRASCRESVEIAEG